MADQHKYEDPPARCPSRCIHEAGHPGACHPDTGGDKYAEARAHWKAAALQMMKARVGIGGGPKPQLSPDKTVGEVAEWCGVHRSTLYKWWHQHVGPIPGSAKKGHHKPKKVQAPAKDPQTFTEAVKAARAYADVTVSALESSMKMEDPKSEAEIADALTEIAQAKEDLAKAMALLNTQQEHLQMLQQTHQPEPTPTPSQQAPTPA